MKKIKEIRNPIDDLAHWWCYEKQRKLSELFEILGVSRESFNGWRRQMRIPLRHAAKVEAMGFKIDPSAKRPRDFTYRNKFDDVQTLEAIAREFGISRERARQLIIAALISFKKELNKRGISMDDVLGPDHGPYLRSIFSGSKHAINE